jgi:hypothetical protein
MTNLENTNGPKPKLADAELVILSSAANRADFLALPVPDTLAGKPVDTQRVLKRLLKRKLVAERPAKVEDPLWRKDASERHLTLRLTPAGFEAINLEAPEDLKSTPGQALNAEKTPRRANKHSDRKASPRSKQKKAKTHRNERPKTRSASKTETVLNLLKRTNGASLTDMIKATGWQPHSVRGFLSAVVKKKLRLALSASDDDKGNRRYHLKSRGKS